MKAAFKRMKFITYHVIIFNIKYNKTMNNIIFFSSYWISMKNFSTLYSFKLKLYSLIRCKSKGGWAEMKGHLQVRRSRTKLTSQQSSIPVIQGWDALKHSIIPALSTEPSSEQHITVHYQDFELHSSDT